MPCKDPEKRRERCHEYYLAHREEAREWHKRYMAEHREEVLEYNRRYAAALPLEKRREYQGRYVAQHREEVRENGRRRRARKRGATAEKITTTQLHSLLESQHGKCAFCKRNIAGKGKKHLDHIVSLSKGGHHALGNLQYLCPPCNRRKAAKPPDEAMMQAGLLPLTPA